MITSISWGQPTSQEIVQAIEQFNTHSQFDLPILSTTQVQSLLNGETLSIIDQQGGENEPRRAVGIRLSSHPKEKLWLSCQDVHFVQQSSTKELRVNQRPPDSADWYGYLDMPWPFSDRHWFVKVWNNHELANKTNNQAWEHPWDLIPNGDDIVRSHIAAGKLDGVTTEMMDDAVYTPVSRGAWAAMDVADSSLFIYHATTQVGGNIPEEVIVRYVRSGLDEMLRNIEKRAATVMDSHYSGDHPLLPGGDGKPVPHFK